MKGTRALESKQIYVLSFDFPLKYYNRYRIIIHLQFSLISVWVTPMIDSFQFITHDWELSIQTVCFKHMRTHYKHAGDCMSFFSCASGICSVRRLPCQPCLN